MKQNTKVKPDGRPSGFFVRKIKFYVKEESYY